MRLFAYESYFQIKYLCVTHQPIPFEIDAIPLKLNGTPFSFSKSIFDHNIFETINDNIRLIFRYHPGNYLLRHTRKP